MPIATKGSKINISSEKKLKEFANDLSIKLKHGDIFFLFGEMGVGKTTFVKYLINNLQYASKSKLTEVTSPTFNIMNEYSISDIVVKHYDLYRIKSSNELNELNLFENNKEEILFIEWPEIIETMPEEVIKLYFEYENNYKNRYLKMLD